MYALTDHAGEQVIEGDTVRWLRGGGEALVQEVGRDYARLFFGSPTGTLQYHTDITHHIEKVGQG